MLVLSLNARLVFVISAMRLRPRLDFCSSYLEQIRQARMFARACRTLLGGGLRDRKLLRTGHEDIRFLSKDKLGISQLSHLWKIEASVFGLGGNAVAEKEFENHVQRETESEDEAQQCRDAYQLCCQLTGVPVKQARD